MLRKTLPLFLFLVVSSVLLTNRDHTFAQGKKEDLAKQVQKLKKQLADRDQAIQKLEAQIQKLKADLKAKKGSPADKNTDKLKKDLAAANKSIKEKDDMIASLQAASSKSANDLAKELASLRRQVKEYYAVKKAPFVHSIVLKTKKDADADQVKKVTDEALRTLPKIEGVRGVWMGTPAEMGTPELAQKGYQLGIVVLLDEPELLEKFLDDPLHKQFTDKLADYWERPVIYDFVREMELPKAEPKKKNPKKKAEE